LSFDFLLSIQVAYTVEDLPKIIFQLLLHEGKSQPGSGPSNVCSRILKICICVKTFQQNAWRNSNIETNKQRSSFKQLEKVASWRGVRFLPDPLLAPVSTFKTTFVLVCSSECFTTETLVHWAKGLNHKVQQPFFTHKVNVCIFLPPPDFLILT
jgi:hypothetical protein